MIRILLMMMLGVVMVGCATSMEGWVAREGGCVEDWRVVRVREVARRFKDEGVDALKVRVLNSGKLGAYSWPTGEIFVTAGLVDAATDEELAAGIAHEVGHLINGRKERPAGLGGVRNKDVEKWADATAVEVMRRAGVREGALGELLEKIAEREPGLRKVLEERVEALRRGGS